MTFEESMLVFAYSFPLVIAGIYYIGYLFNFWKEDDVN